MPISLSTEELHDYGVTSYASIGKKMGKNTTLARRAMWHEDVCLKPLSKFNVSKTAELGRTWTNLDELGRTWTSSKFVSKFGSFGAKICFRRGLRPAMR